MPHHWLHSPTRQFALAAVLLSPLATLPAAAQSVVTYTGQLLNGPQPLSGTYDFQFQLYDAPTGGNKVGPLLTVTSVPVADGVFYTELGFGSVFTGKTLYLQTAYGVHPSAGTATFTVQPARKLAPTSAYAPYAPSAGSAKSLQGKAVSTAAPATNQVLTWSGTAWTPADALAGPQGPIGPTGATGPKGSTGATGATGPSGTPGTTFTAGTGLSLSGGTLALAPGSIDHMLLKSDAASLFQVSAGLLSNPDGYHLNVAHDLLVGGTVIALNGNGGGVGNNNGVARALVDEGTNGLTINYANDFGLVHIPSDVNVDGKVSSATLGTTSFIWAGDNIYSATGVIAGVGVISHGFIHADGGIDAKSLQLNGGSDVAEPYKIAAAQDVKPLPGMVVSIDPDNTGQMRVCAKPYDTTVGGIISGANGIQPGITLRQTGTVADGTLPIASIGRVWCYCDADAGGAISPGDMLTTSATPGHAMRVADHDRAQGAILGKAMSSLKHGKGLVLVLVTLQ